MNRQSQLGLALVVIVGLLFLFSTIGTDKPVRPIEKQVTPHAG